MYDVFCNSEGFLLRNSPQHKLYKIHNLTDEEATLLEPAACAIHGLDKLKPTVGCDVLLIGAGPTGLILAQLLKLNGAGKVTLAANKGIKMDIAKQLDAADEYIELDRRHPEPQWAKLKEDHPYGFDVVVEATGVEKLANDAINYVRRGGTLMIYGVYENKALVHWPPSKIFGDEIRVRLSRLGICLTTELYILRRSLARSRRRIASLVQWLTLTVRRSESLAWWATLCSGLLCADTCTGDRCIQARRLSACSGQDEQQGGSQDCHQALKQRVQAPTPVANDVST